RKRATAEIGAYSYGSLLVDGMASGICRVEKRDGGAELVIRLFGPLKKRQREDVAEEAEALLAFWLPKSDRRQVSFSDEGRAHQLGA
ncbi:MAG: hypothetical protein HY876_10580, partial [Coriobacteriales bacterium]|nr:hypothetical protein [Coriobacteriales bacterium]